MPDVSTPHRYEGLSDAQVAESRARHGANVVTPPQGRGLWQLVWDCRHFWLVWVMVALILLSIPAAALWGASFMGAGGMGRAVLPLVFLTLLLFVWAVALLGGKWCPPQEGERGHFSMDPLISILLAALVLSVGVALYQVADGQATPGGALLEPLGIAVAVLLATGVARWLDARNAKTFRSLEQADDDTPAKVYRAGGVRLVPRRDLVVGDVLLLATGDEVPADACLLESTGLTVNESMFTGEPEAPKGLGMEATEAAYAPDHLLKGSIVLAGSAVAEVTAVGDASESGRVYSSLHLATDSATPLSLRLDRLARLISRLAYLVAALVVVGRVVSLLCWPGDTDTAVETVKYMLDTLMIAVSLVVVAVPEGLPMAVTLSLAFSMRRLMDQKTLPRTLHACETMGATSVICTDKTGTLTQNRMTVADTHFPLPELMPLVEESMAVNTTANLDYTNVPPLAGGERYASEVSPLSGGERYASEVSPLAGGDARAPRTVGSPTEGALLLWLHARGKDYRAMREATPVLERIPFSTEIKYMATVVENGERGTESGERGMENGSAADHNRILYVTGAPDILLALCGMADDPEYNAVLAAWQARAYRTLGLAYAPLPDGAGAIADGQLLAGVPLRMLGVVAINDPIRPEVPGAIRDCMQAGIGVKIVTGDVVGTAKEIGRQVGLWTDADTDAAILTGAQVSALSDEQLRQRLPSVKIISRARPADKERVVQALKAGGQVVAVTGDGINDAPALRRADVGLSMGDGTAVAKEASDMTILDNSFATIAGAVMWGRSLYNNIKRFILFQLTVNVAACVVVLVGSFTGTESPLTVTQMLWVNLIMDTFAALALASLPPSRSVMRERPRPLSEHILHGMGGRIVGVGLLFAVLMVGLLALFLRFDVQPGLRLAPSLAPALTPYELTLFFTAFVLLQFWNLFNARAYMTRCSALRGLAGARWFVVIAAIILVGQVVMVQLGGEMMGVVPGGLGPKEWVALLGTTSLVLWVGEAIRLLSNVRH